MFKPIVRIAAAALVAGATAFAIIAAPAANDDTVTQVQETKATNQFQTAARAGRLSVPAIGTACSALAWPNFEPKCQIDLREPAGEARTVRVIALR